MRWTDYAALLLLAGCATRPLPEIRTVTVPVAVPVRCIERVPERPAALGDVPEDQGAALSRALAKLLEWRAYGVEADGKMRACAAVQLSPE